MKNIKLLSLVLGLVLTGCGKIDNPEPVDENISITDLENGLTKIGANFKGTLIETTINGVDMGLTETRSITSDFEKSLAGDMHLKRTGFDYDVNINLDDLSKYFQKEYGYEPGSTENEALIEEVIHDSYVLSLAYRHEFSDEEIIKDEKEVNLHTNGMNYLGHQMDNDYDSYYWNIDYINYYKFLDGPVTHEYYKGRRKWQRDYDDHSERQRNDLLYFIYDLKNEVDKAIYDETSKSYTFSNDFLLGHADFGNKYRFDLSSSGLLTFFGNENPQEIEIRVEFNTSTKEITKVVLDAKNTLVADMNFTQEYILELNYFGALDSEIELDGFVETCKHENLHYDHNDYYHYLWCEDVSNCKKVISYEKHQFDENGVCSGCSFRPIEYYDIKGDHIPTSDDSIFYYAENLVTHKIEYYGVENYSYVEAINLEDSVVKNENFEPGDITVIPEKDYAQKDSYYLLVRSYVVEETTCLYKDTAYMYMYHVENNIPTLLGTAVDHYEDDTHQYEIVEGSVTRINDNTCHAVAKCKNCDSTFEEDFYVYYQGDYDYELKVDDSYLYLSCEHKIKSYETEGFYFYYRNISYDENGFETITHSHRERETVGTEEIGNDAFVVYYNKDGTVQYVNYGNAKYSKEEFNSGYKYIFSSFGDNSVELIVTIEEIKDSDTCIMHRYETYKIVVNGVTIFEKVSKDIYEDYGESASNHNFEYIDGSLKYDPYFDEYTFRVKCADCGKEFLVEKYVSISTNYGEKTHVLRGYYYYYDKYGSEDYAPVSVTCECEPSEEDENFCKWCEGYIGEIS